MKVYAILPGKLHVEIGSNVDFVSDEIVYNPMEVGKGIVGFHLRGERILPVVDLNEFLNIEKGESHLAVGLREVIFLIWHDGLSLEKPDSERVDLESLSEKVLSHLKGGEENVVGDERLTRQLGKSQESS